MWILQRRVAGLLLPLQQMCCWVLLLRAAPGHL
jgi:hypothetical protein